MLSSIKGERRLSLNHWRYRLLHWCFNVTPPTGNISTEQLAQMDLPKFLYTHYCPLFHLTNMIAIFSPVILFIKLSCMLVEAIYNAIPWQMIKDSIAELKLKLRPNVNLDQPQEAKVVNPEKHKANERFMIMKYICNSYKDIDKDEDITFDQFWGLNSHRLNFHTQEETKAIFDEYMPKVKEARERAKKRKEDIRNALIFWTNFSRVFIKWSLNILYFALTILVMYFAYMALEPAWNILCWIGDTIYWMFTDASFLSAVLFLLKWSVILVFFVSTFVLLSKIGFIHKLAQGMHYGFVKVLPPFYILGRFIQWIGSGISSTIEFIKMFYEENCPPIVIVSPEEEKIEEIALGESLNKNEV